MKACVEYKQRQFDESSPHRLDALVDSRGFLGTRINDQDVTDVLLRFHRLVVGRNVRHSMATHSERVSHELGEAVNLDAYEHCIDSGPKCMRADLDAHGNV